MYDHINQLMDGAETRILAHEIYTGGQLTEFLNNACAASNLNCESAYVEALARGLYRVLGEAYQKALDSIIRMVKEDIISGLIETTGDLEFCFACAARNEIPLMPRDKVIVALRIDARQAGLYELLESVTNAAAALAGSADCSELVSSPAPPTVEAPDTLLLPSPGGVS